MRLKEKIAEVAGVLEKMGHQVYLPKIVHDFDYRNRTHEEAAAIKKQYGLMKRHLAKIEKSDAIIVLNYDVGEIENYIGGNTFFGDGCGLLPGEADLSLEPDP